ncbi:hypothetical protein MKK63_20410 [Methylobacterium sp. J-088]|uniref:hypothetical protein n=1 Tax=Methylobacterium sp. J-088 TaxID=2836664 RepID=UPI001FB87AC8|nr:hypothetical protein [Methylobacterium sp. J-088]MCJ2065055.1 hypothetical protein [Methylobacterium sp. J-088]
MSIAIRDLAQLSSIAVLVLERAITEIEPSLLSHSLRVPKGYITVLLTDEQFQNVHFITGHVKSIAETACSKLEAVEELIVEDARCA